MKKRLTGVLLCFVLVHLFCVTALADCAPKPKTIVYVNSSEYQHFVITLLGKGSYGPHGQVGPQDENPETQADLAAAWDAFAAYEDPNGFCFWGETFVTTVNWGYYAPKAFKVALYFPEYDSLLVSQEVFECYAFNSNFSLNLDDVDRTRSGVVSMQLKGSVDWVEEVLCLIPRILLTLAVEYALAFIWGYRSKRQMKVLLGVNLVTQVLLNVLLSLWVIFDGPFMAALYLAAGEVIVVIIESIFFIRRLPDGSDGLVGSKVWAFGYGLVANLASCMAGYQFLE